MKQTLRGAAMLTALAVLLTGTVPVVAEEPAARKGTVVNAAESVNIRKEPSTESEILGSIGAGQNAEVLSVSADGQWYEIAFGEGTGWIGGYYLKVTEPEKPLSEYTEEERYQYLFGTGVTHWTTDNKPKGYRSKEAALDHMTEITVKVWLSGKRGRRISGKKKLKVNRKLAAEVKQIFKEIYELPEKFPIDTVVGFRWNSKGEVSGPLLNWTTVMSAHAYGAAIDINMYQNDYYVGAGQDFRDKNNRFYITDSVKEIFRKHGWYWGGDFSICTDTMHFQYTGLDALTYNNGSPYTEYSLETTPKASGYKIKNIQRRLKKLGYSVKMTGKMNQATDRAIRAFQQDHGMEVTGVTDEAFYCLLYNLTPSTYDHS
ncbi:MAG: M15 family metallopeptidase [Clostridia bacterium]|nr:M15 family metallopeptidase [Clostridia bacterium]